ncbi:hypothetical protein N7510_009828, partial [Penicillium lagena]|uniref:uncharacterized protein n=1 Tax=Penicillium lagena TaxID=94218 RepID=UPI0025415B5C
MPDNLTKDPSLPVANPTKSYWQSPPHPELLGTQSASLPATRDIVVLGSGITSCSTVLELLNGSASNSITVLEAREVCSGATGRNGGRINCVAILDYDKYRRRFGHEAAEKIVRFELAHYEAIESLVKSFGSEILDRSQVRQVHTTAAILSDQKLRDMKVCLKNFEDAFPDMKGRWWICEGEELSTVGKYHLPAAKGALIGKSGSAWPYRMITDIFTCLLRQYGERLSIETKTPATAIRRDASSNPEFPYIITTPRGQIRAKHVLHCTEAHTAHHVSGLRGILVPRRGQISVQNPGSLFPYKGGDQSWSFYFQNGFDYATQLPQSNDIVIGGGELGGFDTMDEVFGVSADDAEDIPAKIHLAGVLPVIFGEKNWGTEVAGKLRLKGSWVGIMCNSLDTVPMVGKIPGEALLDREEGDDKGAEWISAGYGGYGMVNAFLCGQSLAKMVLGRDVGGLLPDQYRISAERVRRLQGE